MEKNLPFFLNFSKFKRVLFIILKFGMGYGKSKRDRKDFN